MTDLVNLLEDIIPEKNYTTEEKHNLTVLKDTQTGYGGTFANRIKPLSYDAGYKSDVADEFALSWLWGQGIEQIPSLFEIGLTPIDLDYDPFDVDNLKGYEEFALDFAEVRNKEHHDFLKAQIDKNNARRTRLAASRRGMSAALLGNILNPENFVPIPLVKGVSIARNAIKGGLISGGLVAATEPVRRSLDLTATREETMGYIAAATFFGGLFVGGISAFSKGMHKHTIKPTGGINKMAEKYWKAHYKTEGRVDWEANGFIYKVKDDLYDVNVTPDRPTNVKQYGRTKLAHLIFKGKQVDKTEVAKQIKILNDEIKLITEGKKVGITSSLDEQINTARANIAKIKKATDNKGQNDEATALLGKWVKKYRELLDQQNKKVAPDKRIAELRKRIKSLESKLTREVKDRLIVDTGRIRRIFEADYHTYSDIIGVIPIPRAKFKNADDFIQFIMKKEINARVYLRRKKGEVLADYENRLNSRTLIELETDAVASRRTSTHKILESLASFSNYEKVMREFSDPYYAKEMQRLTGDYGTAGRNVALGIPPVTSAMMTSHTKWASHWIRHRYELNDLFGKYRGIVGNQKKILGMNYKVGGIRATDAFDSLIRRFSNRHTADPELMTHPQFMQSVADAVMDNKIFNDLELNPIIKEGAVVVRRFYKKYADEAKELFMFESQGNYKRIMMKKLENIEKLESLLKKDAERIATQPSKSLVVKTNKLSKTLEDQAESKFQYYANKEGGQLVGTRELIVEVTEDLFNQNKLFKVDDIETFADFKKVFETDKPYARLFKAWDKEDYRLDNLLIKGELVPTVTSLKRMNELRSQFEKKWSIKVKAFDAKESIKHSQTFDSDVITMKKDALFDKEVAKLTEKLQIEALTKPISRLKWKHYNQLLFRMKSEYQNIRQQFDDLVKDEIAPPYTQPEEFMQRIWLRDVMMDRRDELIGIFAKWFTQHPTIIRKGKIQHLSTDPVAIKKRAENAFDEILGIEAAFLDGDGLAGWGMLKVKNKQGKVISQHWQSGVRPLMQRKIDIPNHLVKDFISTDTPQLMRDYHMRMSNAIELTNEFGDRHLSNYLDSMEMRLIDKELNVAGDWKRITRVLNAFIDDKDKMLGTLNIQDPAAMMKRLPALLKDWASLSFMGKVIFAALPDSARPIMNNGFKKTFGVPIRSWMKNSEVYAKQIEGLDYMAPVLETAANITRQRFQMDGGAVGLGKGFLNQQFDRVALMANKAQGPFYMGNLLTPWTHGWKTIQGLVSIHRFIEDSVKIQRGTASKFDVDRLGSYGIDEKAADLIANMPWEKNGSQYLANGPMWQTKKGGSTVFRKFSQAVWADYQRTIVTPTHADTFNMMHGVLRIDSEISRNMLRNPVGRFLGYTNTKYGGKVSNAWLGLPFQFFSWAIAANRKLLISGLSHRELAPISGVLAMVTMGILGDYMKNPRYWSQKNWEEKLIRGVELSGVLALFGDINFSLETLSQGTLGARPSLGQKTRFGDPDMTDIIGEFTGAGPSIPLDLLYAFLGDTSFSERSATLRRIIPLNTFWLWDRKFKDLWQMGEDFIR